MHEEQLPAIQGQLWENLLSTKTLYEKFEWGMLLSCRMEFDN